MPQDDSYAFAAKAIDEIGKLAAGGVLLTVLGPQVGAPWKGTRRDPEVAFRRHLAFDHMVEPKNSTNCQ